MLLVGMMLTVVMVSGQTIVDTVTVNNVKPRVSIKVNKVYDEDGIVIGYDSTYVWNYSSSTAGNILNINPDSLFRQFKPWFNNQFNMSDPFSNRFFDDTSMYLDFFNNDHFFDQWQDELFNFKEEMQQLDSLKQLFFKKYLEQKQNENKGKMKEL